MERIFKKRKEKKRNGFHSIGLTFWLTHIFLPVSVQISVSILKIEAYLLPVWNLTIQWSKTLSKFIQCQMFLPKGIFLCYYNPEHKHFVVLVMWSMLTSSSSHTLWSNWSSEDDSGNLTVGVPYKSWKPVVDSSAASSCGVCWCNYSLKPSIRWKCGGSDRLFSGTSKSQTSFENKTCSYISSSQCLCLIQV